MLTGLFDGHAYSIAKNTAIYIPILAMNLNPKFWGSDAKEFRPERWLGDRSSLPEGALEFPSVAFPTFLAGPRSCIGFRFSILEYANPATFQ